jgi:hypothetical protein
MKRRLPCPCSFRAQSRKTPEEPVLSTLSQIRPVSPVHGRLAVGGMAVAVAISADLHLRLSGQVSPIRQTLSEYVYGHLRAPAPGPSGSAAPMFAAMCLALVAGALALLTGIARTGRPGSTGVLLLLGLWCTGLCVCAVVPVDPPGLVPRSPAGNVHNYSAVLAFVSLPAAAWLLTRRSSIRCPWEPRRSTIRRLAVASVAGLAVVLAGFVSPARHEVTLGLFERALFGIDLALLAVMVRPLLSQRRP